VRVISLFSGAGGLDLGFILAGHAVVWANDIDPDAVMTYRKNIGDHIDGRDISLIDSREIPNGDILIAGIPCQGFSVANLKRSSSDERNLLYHQFIRILKAKKPRYFLIENVPGIINLEKGDVFKIILSDLRSSGYDVDYRVLNAADFGVPQSRKRVFIIGTLQGSGAPKFSFPEASHSRRGSSNTLPWRTIADGLIGLGDAGNESIPNNIGSKYRVVERNFTGHRIPAAGQPCPTILARGNGKGGVCAIPLPDGSRRMTIRESARMQAFPDEFQFFGGLNSMYRQVGNAVPVLLALRLAQQFPLEISSKTPPPLSVISLFSGAGGADLGFIKAGFRIIWAIDNFTEAVATYRKNIGNHILEKNIEDVRAEDIPDATVVIGGFPCQGFSVANTQRSDCDVRNKLYLHFVRIVTSKKPICFVAENVPGIISLNKGAVFSKIKEDFSNAGYDVRHFILNAADYGVPQKRRRVFIVGFRKDVKVNWGLFPPPTTHAEHDICKQRWKTVGEAFKNIPDPDLPNNIPNHTYSKYKLRFNNHLGHRIIDPDKPAPTVTARGDTRGGVVVLHHPSNKRRMSVRELATVQDFPIDFEFVGNMSRAYTQIGNAVPPGLARAVALSVRRALETAGPSKLTVQMKIVR